MTQTPAIWLTFDDGPDPRWTPRLLGALAGCQATATFFVIADRARSHPGLIERIRRAGHEVALHCDRHVRHTELAPSAGRRDLDTALGKLRSVGVLPRRWRTPWGLRAPWTAPAAAEHGLALCHWTSDTHDWRGDDAVTMFGRLSQELRPGSVVLMHDGLGPGARRHDCAQTVALVEHLGELCASRRIAMRSLAGTAA